MYGKSGQDNDGRDERGKEGNRDMYRIRGEW
jgi:hypothetical protein